MLQPKHKPDPVMLLGVLVVLLLVFAAGCAQIRGVADGCDGLGLSFAGACKPAPGPAAPAPAPRASKTLAGPRASVRTVSRPARTAKATATARYGSRRVNLDFCD
ncbi:hypothetical protein ACFU6S_06410 [Streptomyces sp. NPDC057456]|uniref:hypothetical protein n=1 Tax=Streptomyces sp. NPDC057456 TaxID=3346139 RepID=UPI00367496C3